MSERPSGSSPENEVEEVEPIENTETETTETTETTENTENAETTENTENAETIEKVNVEPIRTVVRELTRPDGSTVTVEVPVYPPFEMKDLVNAEAAKAASNGKRARSK